MQIMPATYEAHDILSGKRYALTMSPQQPALVRVGAWSAAILNLN